MYDDDLETRDNILRGVTAPISSVERRKPQSLLGNAPQTVQAPFRNLISN